MRYVHWIHAYLCYIFMYIFRVTTEESKLYDEERRALFIPRERKVRRRRRRKSSSFVGRFGIFEKSFSLTCVRSISLPFQWITGLRQTYLAGQPASSFSLSLSGCICYVCMSMCRYMCMFIVPVSSTYLQSWLAD